MRICALLLLAFCALFSACGSGDQTLAQADPNAVPQDPDFQLVWNIMQRDCAPCHTDAEDDDDGDEDEESPAVLPGLVAGVEPDLSTCQGIVDSRFDILESVIDKNDMPPGAWPRLTSEEKLILERWVDNGAKVTTPCP
jgi:uncharacterized membrane protein